jgi:hypothetical protein
LKIWRGGAEYTESHMRFIRCIECGKPGHVKCTKEKVSSKIPIDPRVRDDLEEFTKKFAVPLSSDKSKATKYVAGSKSEDDESV